MNDYLRPMKGKLKHRAVTNCVATFIGVVLISLLSSGMLTAQKNLESEGFTTVIYSTDLWAPAGDPDDHFDILTLMSLKNVRIGVVVIDNTMQANVERTKIFKEPNCSAVHKAAEVFGIPSITCSDGLIEPLKSLTDKGVDQKKELQEGAELILKQLQMSADKSVVVLVVGSFRDVAVAFNRNEQIFHRKVKRMIVSVGDSYGFIKTNDTNTAKDVEAWKRMMLSGLPIDWMPTNPFKGRGGPSRYCSHWYFIQSELLQHCPEKIKDFMVSEGIAPDDPTHRNMWSTPAFAELSEKKYYRMGHEKKWLDPYNLPIGAELLKPYVFVPISLSLDADGTAKWKETPHEESNTRIFRMEDFYLYHESMFQFIKEQYADVK